MDPNSSAPAGSRFLPMPAERLNEFHRRREQIEAMCLLPEQRREALRKARDETGVTMLADRSGCVPRSKEIHSDDHRDVKNAQARVRRQSKRAAELESKFQAANPFQPANFAPTLADAAGRGARGSGKANAAAGSP